MGLTVLPLDDQGRALGRLLAPSLVTRRASIALAFATGLVAVVGCSQNAPAVGLDEIDARSAGRLAVETLDTNSDGEICGAELETAPALLQHLDLYDRDGDQCISASEIEQRISVWREQKVGMRGLTVKVTLDRRPLQDALVEFAPEDYLGDAVKAASGTTNTEGIALISHAPEDIPEVARERGIRGIGRGTYKIRVTHPKVQVPSRYNSETTLGAEVARDTIALGVDLDLESR